MTSVRDFFVEIGRRAENALDDLAGQSEALGKRDESYQRVEAQLEAFAADGSLTRGEVDQLLGQLRAAGLDTAELFALAQTVRAQDGSIKASGCERFRDAVASKLGKAHAELGNKLVELKEQTHVQQMLEEMGIGSASDWDKKQHDIGMAIIRNMSA